MTPERKLAPHVHPRRRRVLCKSAQRAGVWATVLGAVLIAVFPLFWTLATSLKPMEDIAAFRGSCPKRSRGNTTAT